MTCGFRWRAPRQLPPPPGNPPKVIMAEQTCALEQGHDGPHRSVSGVLTKRGR